jgi:two-component system, NarL family, nitrate/nitrite response regulator NarL
LVGLKEVTRLGYHRLPMEESAPTINIVISDDHALFREGLRKLLEAEPGIRIVGEALDGEETLKVVRQLKPHVLLLDLSLPKLSGLQVLAELSKLELPTRTIMLTAAIEREQVIDALQLGVRGIVLKHSALQLLLKSIRCVSEGQFWVGQEGVSDLIQALRRMKPSHNVSKAPRNFGLSSREMEVIGLIVAGYTNKDLARELGISENTAKHHLTNIFDKLGVSNRLELVLYAVDHGLVAGN